MTLNYVVQFNFVQNTPVFFLNSYGNLIIYFREKQNTGLWVDTEIVKDTPSL